MPITSCIPLKGRLLLLLLWPVALFSQSFREDSVFIAANYQKMEYMIPMRDGVRLFTSVYTPKDTRERYPFLMERTPYSCFPYGAAKMRFEGLGPNRWLMREKYIFVYQDVRGRYKSEGDFEEMTPAREEDRSTKQTDESSDTFDTIEWLLKNIGNNNGRVGLYGISYPGFYATASLPHAHPAIRAVSPQAPVTDEFIGDDANHNGAFFLMDNFDFTNYFQGTRIDSGTNYREIFNAVFPDAYSFYKKMEPLGNTNGSAYFNHKSKIWDEYLSHDTYDEYWKQRNIRTHLKNIRPAVLVVGGWFDAEDMFGSLHTYQAIDKQSPGTDNRLVMGPWTHGAWSEGDWDHFGPYHFGQNLNTYFQQEMETNFFNFHLKDKGRFDAAKATVFETGTNQWKQYATWPPSQASPRLFYLGENGTLSTENRGHSGSYDEYVSDPANPVPYTSRVMAGRNNEYLVEDQRFAAQRQDVLSFRTDTLTSDLLVTGPLKAEIFLSTTGTDADLVIKVIDVLPENTPGPQMGGYERMVRAEVFRCRFRDSFEKPTALRPGEITRISFDLNDIAHTFLKGHRIMVQVQSSWFPLVDLNPQTFVDIPTCRPEDFKKATICIYHDGSHPSSISLPVIQ